MPYPFKYPACDCQWCGATYHPKMRERVTFCSRACSYESRRWQRHLSDIARLRDRFRPCTCRQCGVTFRPRKARAYCASECEKAKARVDAMRHYRERHPAIAERPCGRCGTAITDRASWRRLCATCRDINARSSRKASKWQRKALIKGATTQRFKPHDVFARDAWRCQLCGIKTKPNASTIDDRYPTLDHIVPLSKGGAHSRENTQCACRRCNLDKSDNVVAYQTRLLA